MTDATKTETTATREQLLNGLNEDLAREYQAIIAYVVYSQVLNGADYMSIARELEKHDAPSRETWRLASPLLRLGDVG
jgi:bacterioferritin